ncbi:MAG: hypothetical protein J6Z50_03940 [Fibrobacterales bacterium]|nr:hypothetical protein [Fibrobacterales bacterium]MBP5188265.1 hypothetical protein [Fibrobacterales bacterium]MBP5351118.1 hypothetical protein [Fibrobacterales bacterium]
MTKSVSRLLSLLLLCLAANASALDTQAHPVGLGFFVGGGITHGGAVGLHGRYWLNEQNLLSGALTWTFGRTWGGGSASLDYVLQQWPDLIDMGPDAGKMPLYVGVGAWTGFWTHRWRGGSGRWRRDWDLSMGGRVPLGMAYLAKEAPFDAFIELAPGIQVLTSCLFTLDVMIGGHYYF